MKTTFNIEVQTKTNSEDETILIDFNDYRGKHQIKLDRSTAMDFLSELDKKVNRFERK